MKTAARVLEEVQAEIQTRIALADRAKNDAADAERLADLNEAQRLALARLVRAELSAEVDKASKKNLQQGIFTNLVFFALGIVVTVITTYLVH